MYSTPGPTFIVKTYEPLVVRVRNNIDYTEGKELLPKEQRLCIDISVHQHGGHIPAHADGHPNFLIPPGEVRDYYYPNSVPLKASNGQLQHGDWDETEIQGTMWYHDHAEDITAHNALMGLAGLYIMHDKKEDAWSRDGTLPKGMWHTLEDAPAGAEVAELRDALRDVPLVLKDICLCNAGKGRAPVHFDPFDHNGSMGNIILVNGESYPYLEVAPAKYRFRFLNASLARMDNLEFHKSPMARCRWNDAAQFWQIGRDSWLFDKPKRQSSIFLSMANRADVVFDFSQYKDGDVVYLLSTLNQKDGRGPGHGDNDENVGERGEQFDLSGVGRDPIVIMQFRIKKSLLTADDEKVRELEHGTKLRSHEEIHFPSHVRAGSSRDMDLAGCRRREFIFERGQGAWKITHKFFDPCVMNAVPRRDGTELWILKNKSGGWWHPIHIHLESHQQVFAHARNQRGERIVVARNDHSLPRKYEWEEEMTDSDSFHSAREKYEATRRLNSRTCDCAMCRTGGNDTQRVTSFDDSVWNTGIKHDTTVLGPNTEVHILMQFRTFEGPFVFHCHNLNHEDMRMMYQFDPRKNEGPSCDQKAEHDRWHLWIHGKRANCHTHVECPHEAGPSSDVSSSR